MIESKTVSQTAIIGLGTVVTGSVFSEPPLIGYFKERRHNEI
jgi:hypothetical protein